MAKVVIDLCIAAEIAIALGSASLGCGNGGHHGGPAPLFATGQLDESNALEAVVLRSDDLGESWSIVGTQRFALPITLRLFDDQHGVVLSGTSFFSTEDGAQTWQRLSGAASVPPIDDLKGGLVFAPERAALFGERLLPGSQYCSTTPTPALASSSDAGATWNGAPIEGGDGSAFTNTTLTLGCVAGDTNALLLGWDRPSPPCVIASGLFVSRTRGETWESAWEHGYAGFVPRRVACTNEGGFWVLGGGSLWHSPDGGTSWADDSASIPDDVTVYDGAISFIDQMTGWLVGSATDHDVLLATQDGAVTWHSVPLPDDVREVVFFDQTHGFAAADGGQAPFHVTDDRGNTWKAATLPAEITRVAQAQLAPEPR